MFRSLVITILGITAFVSAIPAERFQKRGCATHVNATQIEAVEAHFRAHQLEGSHSAAAPITIDIHWHVINSASSYNQGFLTREQILSQVLVLNKDYESTGVSFNLLNISYTTNAEWFRNIGPSTSYEWDAKLSLHRGDAKSLNVYTTGFSGPAVNGILGYSSLPWWYLDDSIGDGVVIKYSVLPNGSETYYNLGKTLVHEVGHWMGLYHTFEGGCYGNGDLVSDTPASASPSYGCPTGRDSCPDMLGLDPIHNFMDYSDDDCLTEWSTQQIDRMRQELSFYRGL